MLETSRLNEITIRTEYSIVVLILSRNSLDRKGLNENAVALLIQIKPRTNENPVFPELHRARFSPECIPSALIARCASACRGHSSRRARTIVSKPPRRAGIPKGSRTRQGRCWYRSSSRISSFLIWSSPSLHLIAISSIALRQKFTVHFLRPLCSFSLHLYPRERFLFLSLFVSLARSDLPSV